MQYTKEVALLEAAFQLAEKQYADIRPGCTCLGETRPADSSPAEVKQTADTLITGITEIIDGLEYPASQSERKHSSFVMHSVLFDSYYKQVLFLNDKKDPKETSFTGQNNACYDILDVFPRIGSMLYYILLVRLKWGHLFGQMVSVLPEHTALILQEILTLSTNEPQQEMEDFVADIVSGMLPNVHSKTHPVIDLVLTSRCTASAPHPEKWKNLLVFFDILFDILMKTSEDSKKDVDTHYKITSSCISCLLNFLNSEFNQKPTVAKNINHLDDTFQSIKSCTVPAISKSFNDIPVQFYQKLQQLLPDESVNKFASMTCKPTDGSTDGDLSDFAVNFLNSLYSCIGACRLPEAETSNTLQHANEQGKARFRESCYQLLRFLKPFVNETGELEETFPHLAWLEKELDQHPLAEETDRSDASPEVTQQTFEDDLITAVWRVDNRLIGYKECLLWLLQNSSHYCTNELWISCLEKNSASLSNLKLLQCLVDCTIEHQLRVGDKTKSKLVERLLKVLLESIKMLSIGIQNRIRDYFTYQQRRLLPYYLYEEYNPMGLQQQIVTTFNKLVNSSNSKNIQELLQYVSPIAFQSPRQTIQKAVLQSVTNAGVVPLVSQIFQEMTSLCSYKESEHLPTFLCITLHDSAIKLSSPKQQIQFTGLIKALLQQFKPPLQPDYPYLKAAVLSSQELLQVCIYPNLYHHNIDRKNDHSDRDNGHLNCDHLNKTTPPKINLLLCLQLLKITLDVRSSRGMVAESVDSVHRFPIMLCLASFINESVVLWDAIEECGNREDVKELSKSLLQVLCKSINEQCTDNDIKGLQWLMFKVRSFHWSVALYLRFLLADCLNNKEVADQFSISNFFNMEWKATHINTEFLEKDFLAFLQCCQVSPTIGEIHLQSISRTNNKDEFLIALVQALVQLLPQCTQPEWYNITTMLKTLLDSRILHVPLGTEFINKLPLIDLKEYSVELGISSLFMMLFELLGGVSCSWSQATGIWQHTVKCYVTIMKDLLSNIQIGCDVSSPGQAVSRGFLIGQLFCHSLKVMGYIPESVKGQLFVLTLELASMLEDSKESAVREMYSSTKQYQIFENLVLCNVDGEERNTLQQKLKTLENM